jgi:hypothetical protein
MTPVLAVAASGSPASVMVGHNITYSIALTVNCPYRKSNPAILVMQSTKDRTGQNASRHLGGT